MKAKLKEALSYFLMAVFMGTVTSLLVFSSLMTLGILLRLSNWLSRFFNGTPLLLIQIEVISTFLGMVLGIIICGNSIKEDKKKISQEK